MAGTQGGPRAAPGPARQSQTGRSPPRPSRPGGGRRGFRSWPYWVQAAAWTALGVVVALAAVLVPDTAPVGDSTAPSTVIYQCADGETRASPCPPPPTEAPTTTTESSTATEPSPTTEAPPPPSGPATTIPEGIYAVGADIEPGRYHASGRGNCYWATLRDDSGEPDAVISTGLSQGGSHQTSVDIGDEVAYFESHGCGTWVKG